MSALRRRILVAGVGNVFLGDDAFGVEVVRRLTAAALPPGVRVRDFGTGGLHLAYELLDGYDLLVLVDAMSRGEPPGTVVLFEPDVTDRPAPGPLDAHGLDPASVLASLAALGGSIERILVVGCEPESVAERMGLSPVVERAVPEAVSAVLDLVRRESARPGALLDG